jgi:hypothetical protein
MTSSATCYEDAVTEALKAGQAVGAGALPPATVGGNVPAAASEAVRAVMSQIQREGSRRPLRGGSLLHPSAARAICGASVAPRGRAGRAADRGRRRCVPRADGKRRANACRRPRHHETCRPIFRDLISRFRTGVANAAAPSATAFTSLLIPRSGFESRTALTGVSQRFEARGGRPCSGRGRSYITTSGAISMISGVRRRGMSVAEERQRDGPPVCKRRANACRRPRHHETCRLMFRGVISRFRTGVCGRGNTRRHGVHEPRSSRGAGSNPAQPMRFSRCSGPY